MSNIQLPILYSFRRCPYAIRARLALKVSALDVVLREIKLSNKPAEMLTCSPKGTVPVLLLPNGTVIDESKDIMEWALNQSDPNSWLSDDVAVQQKDEVLIDYNDNEFKKYLDLYKYADRYPEKSVEYYRQQGEVFLEKLECELNKTKFILKDNITFVDMAIFPFIRQFAFVDKDWFDKSQYKKLKKWLELLLGTSLFNDVMKKHPVWSKEDNSFTLL